MFFGIDDIVLASCRFFATVGSTVEDRYLIISLRYSKGNGCLPKMFSEIRQNVNGLKNSDKEIDNNSTISRLPGTGCRQQTDMHFSHRLYLIILLSTLNSEVKDVLTLCSVCHCEWWFSF